MNQDPERVTAVHNAVGAVIQASRLHNRGFDRLGAEQGINRSPCMILTCLNKYGEMPSQRELADYFGISPACVARTLKSLSADGLIRRSEGKGDQRLNRVSITEQGRALTSRIEQSFQAFDLDMFSGFTSEDLRVFKSLMDRIIGNLRRMETEPAGHDNTKGSALD